MTEKTSFIKSQRFPWYLIGLSLVITAWILFNRGMVPWCKWDSPLWLISMDAWSKHNSQHLLDPYSFTHYLHGFLFFWILNLALGKKIPFIWLLVIAVVGECMWELLENSPTVIEKYRANTASLEYYGDSILNAIGDIICCIVGFWSAEKLKFKKSLAVFIFLELILVFWIRDSLLLNIIMLTFPIEAIKIWQAG